MLRQVEKRHGLLGSMVGARVEGRLRTPPCGSHEHVPPSPRSPTHDPLQCHALGAVFEELAGVNGI